MKKSVFLFLVIFCFSVSAQQKTEPWNPDQLMECSELASKINLSQTADMLILSVGPEAIIKGSVDMGPAKDVENLKNLRTYLEKVPRDKTVVIYCGCCPFSRCPNIRPAFELLKEMGFSEPKLLDIPQNIRVDWISHDYPTQ